MMKQAVGSWLGWAHALQKLFALRLRSRTGLLQSLREPQMYLVGRPGMVIMSPTNGMTKPAPALICMYHTLSLTSTPYLLGRTSTVRCTGNSALPLPSINTAQQVG